jgi:Flp pilus assembly protein TadG
MYGIEGEWSMVRIARGRREDGAAAVEFAIVVGVLALLVFGVVEFGLVFWQVQNLRSATREAARVAAVRGNTTQISNAMVAASAGSLPAGYTGFSVTPSGGCTASTVGQEVTVTINNAALSQSVRSAFQLDIPFLPVITLNPTIAGTFRCE